MCICVCTDHSALELEIQWQNSPIYKKWEMSKYLNTLPTIFKIHFYHTNFWVSRHSSVLKGLWKKPVLPSGFSQAHPAVRVLPRPPAPPAAAAAAPRPPRKCAPSKQNPGSHLTMGTPALFLRYGGEVLAVGKKKKREIGW